MGMVSEKRSSKKKLCRVQSHIAFFHAISHAINATATSQPMVIAAITAAVTAAVVSPSVVATNSSSSRLSIHTP